MEESLEGLIAGWDGLAVVARHDAAAGAWIFIALHDATLGSAAGGTRMKVYPSPAAGLRDAMRLAEGMTHKWAAIEAARGGGKAVITLSRPLADEERTALLRRYGRLVAALGGSFSTGVDLGTTPADMEVIVAEAPGRVHGAGTSPAARLAAPPGHYTARGVLAGIQAAARQAFGDAGLAGRTVLVEGLGAVGEPLSRRLAAAGARLLLADLDPARAEALAAELGAGTVPVEAVAGTPCDVYAPCAVGGTLSVATIPRLACRAVAGAANNQLAEPADADRLHARGILYAPDYVTNAGAVLAFTPPDPDADDEAAALARVDRIGALLGEVFAEAAERDESPVHAARRRVERVLARARGG